MSKQWVSKPCSICECPEWNHGGPSGCYGNLGGTYCGGCPGFDPDESDEDIICDKELQDKHEAISKKVRAYWWQLKFEEELQTGNKILHKKFGEGTVVGPWPESKNTWAVMFDDESLPKPFPLVPKLEPDEFGVIK